MREWEAKKASGGGAAQKAAEAEAGSSSVDARAEGTESRAWHTAPVAFPWRIAPGWLHEMKQKAPELRRIRAQAPANMGWSA